VEEDVECLPFQINTFNVVVSTLTYCFVSDPNKALSEVYIVSKRGDKVYFIEHVIQEDKICKSLANNLNSAWNKVCKCNLNRYTLKNTKNTGFKVDGYEWFGKFYLIFIKRIGIKE